MIRFTTGLDILSVKSGIIYIISHNYAKIKVDSNNFLPLKKQLFLCYNTY